MSHSLSEGPADPAVSPESPGRKRRELMLFLFLTVVLFPLLSVALVGGLGFVIWIYQMIMGPPGPPPG